MSLFQSRSATVLPHLRTQGGNRQQTAPATPHQRLAGQPQQPAAQYASDNRSHRPSYHPAAQNPPHAPYPSANAPHAFGHHQHPAELPAELTIVFGQMRRYLQLSPYQVAALVQTDPAVIEALETGVVRDLPAWPETERVVRAYLGLAHIDPTEVLRCLYRLIGDRQHVRPAAPAPQPPHAGMFPGTAAGMSGGMMHANAAFSPAVTERGYTTEEDHADEYDAADVEDGHPSARSWYRRWLPRPALVWRLSAAAAVLGLLGYGTQSNMLEAAAGKLPPPLGGMARAAHERMLIAFAPRFEGMALISVPDPRTRRADKLRVSVRR